MAEKSRTARLWISHGGEAARSVALAEGPNTVGRGEQCEVRLEDESISWDHLRLEARGPSVLATDLDSSNGTTLNGEPLDRTRRLRNGDVLQVGPFRLELALPPQIRHERTAAAPRSAVSLSEDERETAVALVAQYRSEDARAPRPATRAEIAAALHVSERTVQRRLDALAQKLGIEAGSGRERPRLIAERVLELGADRG